MSEYLTLSVKTVVDPETDEITRTYHCDAFPEQTLIDPRLLRNLDPDGAVTASVTLTIAVEEGTATYRYETGDQPPTDHDWDGAITMRRIHEERS